MAIIQFIIHCGCGFHTQKFEEATEHADAKKHEMTIIGGIKPSVEKSRKESLPTRAYQNKSPKKYVPAMTPLGTQTEDKIVFGDLRARLRNK